MTLLETESLDEGIGFAQGYNEKLYPDGYAFDTYPRAVCVEVFQGTVESAPDLKDPYADHFRQDDPFHLNEI